MNTIKINDEALELLEETKEVTIATNHSEAIIAMNDIIMSLASKIYKLKTKLGKK